MFNIKKMLIIFLSFCFVSLTMEPQRVYAQTESEFTSSDGVILHYKIIGQGSPVLLLSGGPGMSSDYLLPIAMEIAKTNQAILLDQRGTGKSQLQVLDDSTINLKAAVNDIEVLRLNLKIDKIILLGHSWGGMLSMSYAAEYPAHVRALVLVVSGGMTTDFFGQFQANLQARLLPSELETMAFWSDPSHISADPVRAANEIAKATLPAFFYNRDLVKGNSSSTESNLKVNQIMINNLIASQYDLRSSLKDLKQPVRLQTERKTNDTNQKIESS